MATGRGIRTGDRRLSDVGNNNPDDSNKELLEVEEDNTLHPVGVAEQPTAMQPHTADAEPNKQETVEATDKPKRQYNRNFKGVLDEFSTGEPPAPKRGPRTSSTDKVVDFVRSNRGKWCKVGHYAQQHQLSPKLRTIDDVQVQARWETAEDGGKFLWLRMPAKSDSNE